ncbi:MAG TPA: hypothetical protein DCM87_07050 [Planctomycetes bacterium]|nr:hypothetical protein [Planctomycetota bacterium]
MRHGTLAAFLAAAMLLPSLAGLRAASPSSSDIWTTDVAKALERAAKEKKDVLMDFTGSDWCGWCVKLDGEVFSQEAFIKEAPKQFVLIKLDFPKKTKLPPDLEKQNQEWLEKFGVQGFPTIILADAKGRPYAKMGYQPGGPEAYLKHLRELAKNGAELQAAFAKAGRAQGIEKAKLLDKALASVDPSLVGAAYKDLFEEIIAADADNKAGLKSKYALVLVQNDVQAAMNRRDPDGAMVVIEKAFKDLQPSGAQAQELYVSKGLIQLNKGDKEAAIATLQAAIAAEPGSERAKQVAGFIERLTQPPAKDAGKK